jgi:membrane protein implicated in regulation of membrane protease activity
MGPVTLWNLLFVVGVIIIAALVAGLVWAYRRFTRRYREQRKQLNASHT